MKSIKKQNRALSLEQLSSHQQRIRSIVRKINEYSPTFHVNHNYNHSQIMNKIKKQRQNYEDRIFEQNLKIIEKLQNIQPKINTKFFPSVNLTARSKRKSSSLSQKKFKQSKGKMNFHIKTEDEIIQENIQMIEKLQTMEKKINCWQDKSLLMSRALKQKKEKRQRNQILEKFKEISMQMKSLRMKNDQSRIRAKSPYISDSKVRKESQASFQTKANSFFTKKPQK